MGRNILPSASSVNVLMHNAAHTTSRQTPATAVRRMAQEERLLVLFQEFKHPCLKTIASMSLNFKASELYFI